MKEPIAPRLLNLPEAAIYLGTSRAHLDKLIDEKKIPVVYMGNRRRLDREDLDTYVSKLPRRHPKLSDEERERRRERMAAIREGQRP